LDELAGARGLIVAVLHGFQVRAFAATDVVGSSSDAAYAEAGRRPVETAAPAEPRGYRCSGRAVRAVGSAWVPHAVAAPRDPRHPVRM